MLNRQSCPLRHANGNCLPIGGFCTSINDQICGGLRQAYDLGRGNKLGRWVSVKDRLPEKSGWYLVSILNTRTGHRWKVPVSADYSHGKWDYSYLGVEDDATWILNNTVTHWMPRPELPEEVNEDA